MTAILCIDIVLIVALVAVVWEMTRERSDWTRPPPGWQPPGGRP